MKNIYLEYLKYVLEHKKNVMKVCFKKGQYIHGITHDLSKFGFEEFVPYAQWFYGKYGVKLKKEHPELLLDEKSETYKEHIRIKEEMEKAWKHHYMHNKHHWDYWVYDDNGEELPCPKEMDINSIEYMISDWDAMSIKFGGSSLDFYFKNRNQIKLNHNTRVILEYKLGLINDNLYFDSTTFDQICEAYNLDPNKEYEKIKKK